MEAIVPNANEKSILRDLAIYDYSDRLLGGPIAEKGSYPGGSARPAQDPASGSQSSANPDPGPPTPHPVIDVGSSWVLLRKKGSWGGPAGGVERTRSTGSCALAGDRPVRAVGTPGCRSSDARAFQPPPDPRHLRWVPPPSSAPARRVSSSAAARTDSADTVSNTPRGSLARSFAAWLPLSDRFSPGQLCRRQDGQGGRRYQSTGKCP